MQKETRNEAIRIIDNYLTYIALTKADIKEFDKSMLLTSDFLNLGIIDGDIAVLDAGPRDLEYSWDCKIIQDCPPSDCPTDAMFCLSRCHTVGKQKVMRWAAKMPNSNPENFDCFSERKAVFVLPDGGTWKSEIYFGHRKDSFSLFDPSEYHCEDGAKYSLEPTKRQLGYFLRAVYGMEHMKPSRWVAYIGISEDSPRVGVWTDPTGVKELWKLRDVGEGKSRRDALLHWVNDHWRQNRKDQDVENYVRSHLRGSRRFRQGSLNVEIHESTKDAESCLQATENRARLRRLKQDFRKRKEI